MCSGSLAPSQVHAYTSTSAGSAFTCACTTSHRLSQNKPGTQTRNFASPSACTGEAQQGLRHDSFGVGALPGPAYRSASEYAVYPSQHRMSFVHPSPKSLPAVGTPKPPTQGGPLRCPRSASVPRHKVPGVCRVAGAEVKPVVLQQDVHSRTWVCALTACLALQQFLSVSDQDFWPSRNSLMHSSLCLPPRLSPTLCPEQHASATAPFLAADTGEALASVPGPISASDSEEDSALLFMCSKRTAHRAKTCAASDSQVAFEGSPYRAACGAFLLTEWRVCTSRPQGCSLCRRSSCFGS